MPSSSQQDDEFSALWADPMSRRRLLQIVGLGAGGMAMSGLLAACSSGTNSGTNVARTHAPTDSSTDPSSVTGGTLAVAAETDFGTFAIPGDGSGAITLLPLVFERLYQLEPFPPRDTLSPVLAVEMPRELTPTKYRFKIREGATFHDGAPLSAEDVKFTIDLYRNPETNVFSAKFLSAITEVRTIGTHEIELDLAFPTALLAERLGILFVGSKPALEESSDASELNPVGSGPFRVLSATSGQRVSLERFADYTGPHDIRVDRIEFTVVADANARVAGLRSGQTDLIQDVPSNSFAGLRDTEGIVAESVPTNFAPTAYFHCGKPPFDDNLVRRAVLFAIDRDSITQAAYSGLAEPAWESYFRPENPGYVKPETTYRYDPAHARELLSEAGYGDEPVPIQLLVPTTPEYFSVQGPIVEQNLRDVGFDPELVSGEYFSLISRLVPGEFNLFLGHADATALGATDLEFQMRWLWYGFIPRNMLHWEGETTDRLEELLDKALAEPDDAVREQLLAEAQNIIQDEGPLGALHHRLDLTAWSEKVKEFQPAPADQLVVNGVHMNA